jgi:flavin-dependent dehydrogenase
VLVLESGSGDDAIPAVPHWVAPAGVGLCETLGLDARSAGAAAFHGVRLFSWDFKRSAKVEDAALCGWVAARKRFDGALRARARAAGARMQRGIADGSVILGEDRVSVELADDKAVGRLLIAADGLDSPTARAAHLSPAGRLPVLPTCWCATWPEARPGASASSARSKHASAGLDVLVGPGRTTRTAVMIRDGGVSVAMLAASQAGDAQADFRALLRAAHAAELAPDPEAARIASSRSPAGVALDVESHVGKRCLVVGEAGGFVAAFSNESLYPAMMSGVVAAETAARALQAPVLQDELASFGAAWRTKMADYLRLPNTDLSLMPTMLGNPRIAQRLARAFLLGEPF